VLQPFQSDAEILGESGSGVENSLCPYENKRPQRALFGSTNENGRPQAAV